MTDLKPSLPIVAAAPKLDAVAICHRLAGYDFSWELNRSLEIAVLKTFCVPRISRLLRQTGEFEHRAQKRYDDTTLILGNILKWGYDSPQGRSAINQMNRIHQRYPIHNEDFLYVLSTLIYEPIRWNQLFGWRSFTSDEKQALFEFWRVVGERMALRQIPETYEAFQDFNQAYEAEHFDYHPDNRAIGDAVVRLMQEWLPAIATPVIPVLIRAVADEPLRLSLGWSAPSPGCRRTILSGLHLRQQLMRRLPRRQRSRFGIDRANRTYPNGYQMSQLGPAPAAQSTSRCPFLRMRAVLKGEL
ncbi:MAG: oxygenase MpaB family protein [Cyanobacteria bacterium P01_H01_bin.152]